MSHDSFGDCNERPKQYVIYADAYKSENYKCEMIWYVVKNGKIYVYIAMKYANYGGNYQAIIFICLTR